MRATSLLPFAVVAVLFASTSPILAQAKDDATVLVVHGGAGVLTEAEMKAAGVRRQDIEAALAASLRAGYATMQVPGKTSVDGVEAAIRSLEDSGVFNAGRGAVFNHDGRVELDASIMEGRMEGKGEGTRDPRKRAGAVAGVAHVKNPISAARAVMEMKDGKHAMLFGDGAEAFVFTEANRARFAIEKVSNVYFWSDRRLKQIRQQVVGKPALQKAEANSAERRFGTVGAVARSGKGMLAAGTSTGGLSNKFVGRIGDSPVIGAGTYADDRACGVSCTGTGELFIRHAVAHDVVARMLYKKIGVAEAARETINDLPDEDGGVGGFIALDKAGKHAFAMSPRSDGMYRGYVTAAGDIYVGIFANEKEKRMPRE
jgi:beta-aspartyl-peptidase (threonine type)